MLGLNIVKTETDTNRITISDRYVRKTCKALCAWLNGDRLLDDPDSEFAKIYGQISFIRQCSADSYAKLQRMAKVKYGYNGAWTAESTKSKNESKHLTMAMYQGQVFIYAAISVCQWHLYGKGITIKFNFFSFSVSHLP